MSQVSTNDFSAGMKIEMEGQPYIIVANQFVKPGKGQAFNRVKLRQLMTGRVIEKTFKSGEKFDVADVVETNMRLLYREGEDAVFMDDDSFEQLTIVKSVIGDSDKWLKEDIVYDVVLYKGDAVHIDPPTFMELEITECDPGVRGDTASGRVLKPGVTETGAKVQVPLFVDQGEVCKFDTRTGDYVSRVSK